MLFRRLVLCALLVATAAGLLLSAVQYFWVIPIIQAAERFERAQTTPGAEASTDEVPPHEHARQDRGSHAHAASAWEPSAGAERNAYTVLANVLIAAAFALFMLVAMTAARQRRMVAKVDWRYGLLWGVAGYAVFFLAPALGLPPEIPGTIAAPLESRQLWWLLSVVCAGTGLAGAVFGRNPWRWAALLVLAIPYLVGVPHSPDYPFAQHPPAEAGELGRLAQRFVWVTALANALFWLALGSAAGWMAQRLLKSAVDQRVV